MDPIIIDIYGGSDRAVINGENNLCCIYLDNKQGIEIHNLELINDGGTNPNVNATHKRLGYMLLLIGELKNILFLKIYIYIAFTQIITNLLVNKFYMQVQELRLPVLVEIHRVLMIF